MLVLVLAILPITGLLISLVGSVGIAPTSATPAPAVRVIGVDQPVTFVSGGVTYYGSFRGPIDATSPVPAVLIIGGTGDIDRNGNTSSLATNSYSWIADRLAELGFASLRYDKLGTGETGLGLYAANPSAMLPLSYEQLRVRPARDGLSFLAARPGVNPRRVLLLGHSEGGAVSLIVATARERATSIAGLVLVEPAYTNILDIVTRQLTEQTDEAVEGGAITAADGAALTTWLNAGVAQIRDGSAPFPRRGRAPLPAARGYTALMQRTIESNIYGSDPAQMIVTHAYRTAYGKQYDAVAPEHLARLVSAPTLITCGTKDFNTPCGDLIGEPGVRNLAANFGPGIAELQVIPNMVHVLRDIGATTVPDIHQQITHPFSQDLNAALAAFVSRFTKAGGTP